MRVPHSRVQSGVSINMTPMIDIVFLLIIFFLVSSHLAKQENHLKLDLPVAMSGIDEVSDQATVTIQITPQGEWQLNGQSTSLEALAPLLRQKLVQVEGNLRVRIRTDRHQEYEVVSPLLKLCGELGISDLVFSVVETKGAQG